MFRVVCAGLAIMQLFPVLLSASPQRTQTGAVARELAVTVGKSLILESSQRVLRVSVGDPAIAEAVVMSPREIIVNGKTPGETSIVVWQEGGNRLIFDISVQVTASKVEAVRRELREELQDQIVTITVQDENVFLRGTVKDLSSAERALAIASTLGKPINLLRVNVPAAEPQILLRVRFADVDRTAVTELGANLFSTGAANTIGSISTQQFGPPKVTVDEQGTKFSLTDALNIFLFRRDLDLGATIRAFQNRRLLQILAEPNVLAINGKPASFLAGGEFPFPTLQGGGAGLGAVTIQFREFGVRINFLPVITPRGTIRLQVTPEVSSLDFANGLVFQGFNIPALATRRVDTEIELESGQSFVIGGLLDNRLTETISKIPGLGDVPILGKLFQSKAANRSNSELLVLVTPELVRPVQEGQPVPDVQMPKEFLRPDAEAPRTPPAVVTGPPPAIVPQSTVPVEQLVRPQQPQRQTHQQSQPLIQFVPQPVTTPAQNPAAAPLPGR